MLRAANVLFALAGLALVGAVLSPVIRAPTSFDDDPVDTAERAGSAAFGGAQALWREASRSTAAPALAGLAVALAIGSRVAGARRKLLHGQAMLQVAPELPPEAMDSTAIREALLQLAAGLRPIIEAPEPDVVMIFDTLLRGAINLRASDLHFQPLEACTQVSFRVGGVLEEVVAVPSQMHQRLVMRVKVLARLVTYKSEKPQDGHLTVDSAGGATDVRVSLLPTNHGEKVVLRIARAGVQIPELAALGVSDATRRRYLPMLAKPQGLIFLTGPTGSGKTTTIYASLGHIKKERGETTHISTIEDPVEFDVPFLSQTPVRAEAGLTFAQGLRSMLRQDPNVMMVGEIRDAETARIAIQAGLSGHLILTTVHAESAAGVFNRLIEIGVEPFVLASASLASMSQRLVRVLCPHCRRHAALSPLETERLDRLGAKANMTYEPVGCARCGNRGFLGRTAIYELLEVTKEVRELVNARVPTPQIAEQAAKQGMESMLLDGLAKVAAGVTSLEEVLRVAG